MHHAGECDPTGEASTNLIPPQVDPASHLTAARPGNQLKTMKLIPAIFGRSGRLAALCAYCSSLGNGRRRIATIAAAVLAFAVAYHVVFGANGLTAYEQKRQQTQFLAQQMQDLQRENNALQGHVGRLQNDPDAIEHQAREELHYTRPGEVIYTLPEK
jgi:cell division protein FtsB